MIPFVKLIDRSTGNLVCINANYIVQMVTVTPSSILNPGIPCSYTLITLQGAGGALGVDMTIEQIDALIYAAQKAC